MPTYAEQNGLAKDAAFIDRVESALVANAKFIAASGGESAARKALAYLILNDTRTYAVAFAYGVATDVGVSGAFNPAAGQSSVQDATINGAIAAVYNSYVQP